VKVAILLLCFEQVLTTIQLFPITTEYLDLRQLLLGKVRPS
jgi:hypothetical protein